MLFVGTTDTANVHLYTMDAFGIVDKAFMEWHDVGCIH